jgi:VIT1/CCC1 family predicted Fe2+/Mn2+ transporter
VHSAESSSDSSTPQYEPWLGVTASSFIPMVAMFVLPQAFMWPMIAFGLLLLATGMFMLWRQERNRKGVRDNI